MDFTTEGAKRAEIKKNGSVGHPVDISDRARRLGLVTIGVLGVLTYLPAFNNFFISDDFVFLRLSKLAQHHLLEILNFPPDMRRLTGHIYFIICYKLFRLHAAGYYVVTTGLHLINSYLVYILVARLTKEKSVGLIAGLFFVVYERHQEAVLWIAAVHELFLCLSALLCLISVDKFMRAEEASGKYYALVVLTFVLSLFSKESSIVLFPLLLAYDLSLTPGSPEARWARRIKLYLPLGGLWIVYAVLGGVWNNYIAHGLYAITLHFFPVYLKTANRLLIFVYALAALLYISNKKYDRHDLSALSRDQIFRFFVLWLLLTPVPYCFLTYLDHVPSRQTYLPSVATAGLVGMLAAPFHAALQPRRWGNAIVAFILGGILLFNLAYVWKKDRQFVKRAEPAQSLIHLLNADSSLKSSGGKVYVVIDSPMGMENDLQAAVELFTNGGRSNTIFLKPGDEAKFPVGEPDYVLKWNNKSETLEIIKRPALPSHDHKGVEGRPLPYSRSSDRKP